MFHLLLSVYVLSIFVDVLVLSTFWLVVMFRVWSINIPIVLDVPSMYCLRSAYAHCSGYVPSMWCQRSIHALVLFCVCADLVQFMFHIQFQPYTSKCHSSHHSLIDLLWFTGFWMARVLSIFTLKNHLKSNLLKKLTSDDPMKMAPSQRHPSTSSGFFLNFPLIALWQCLDLPPKLSLLKSASPKKVNYWSWSWVRCRSSVGPAGLHWR